MRSNVSINLYEKKNKKCGSRSISKPIIFITKRTDSAIKIQFIKAAIADNKSK